MPGKKKDAISTQIDIYIKTAYNLPEEISDKQLFFTWRRGGKNANRGKSENVTVSGGIALFGTSISLKITLFRVVRTKKFESKKIEIEIKMIENDKKKSTKNFGVLEFDLAAYGEAGKYEALTFPITVKMKQKKTRADKKKKKNDEDEGMKKLKEPAMKMDIVTKWTHVNKKVLVEGKDSGEKITVGGVSYGLETDPNAVSDDEEATTAGELTEHGENENNSEEEPEEEEEEDEGDAKGKKKMKILA